MATTTSFKQQCPSCEAMVPIRDPSLIGRKIDCPKCKYRFVVEEPASEEPEEAPPAKGGKKATGITAAAGAKGKPGAKPGPGTKADKGDKGEKKEGSNKVLGIGLAVVALALLGVGAYLLFFSGSDEK